MSVGPRSVFGLRSVGVGGSGCRRRGRSGGGPAALPRSRRNPTPFREVELIWPSQPPFPTSSGQLGRRIFRFFPIQIKRAWKRFASMPGHIFQGRRFTTASAESLEEGRRFLSPATKVPPRLGCYPLSPSVGIFAENSRVPSLSRSNRRLAMSE